MMNARTLLPRPLRRFARRSLNGFDHLKSSLKKSQASLLQSIQRDYSQSGETIAVRELTRRRHGGVFVEIGANDGLSLSTTYGLLKDGWRGWCVEANPATYQRLVRNVSRFERAKPINCAVAPSRGKMRLYLGRDDPEGFYSTLCQDNSEWFDQHRSETYVEVDGIPLGELLSEQAVPQFFDLLLVDTEGMDLEILQTMDPHRHRPFLIVTEDYHEKNDAKFALLQSWGYAFSRRVGCNTFWTDHRSARPETTTPSH